MKALSEGSNPDGGYTVPLEIERTIDRVLAKASPIRAIATVRQIGGGTYRKPIITAGAASGWTGETDAISSPTTTPTLAALDSPTSRQEIGAPTGGIISGTKRDTSVPSALPISSRKTILPP